MHTIITTSDDGARLRVAGDTVRILASAAQTGGGYELFELEGPAGSGPPPHAHPWSEAYVVVDGEADVWIEGQRMQATRGSFFHIPAGTTHGYRIRSATAKFMVITSPGGASGFFTELDAETAGSCDDMSKVLAVAIRHGFTIPAPA